MNKQYDVIIVGAGTMGMSAGYYLARKGIKTLLLDRWLPPHDKGSHHGDTRLIRYAYSDGGIYVPLILRSYELWKQLEEESGTRVFEQTGVISLGTAESNLIRNCQISADQFGLSIEMLKRDEISRRWSGITAPEDFVGCYEPTAGVLFSEASIRAYRELALQQPSTELVTARVERISLHREGCIAHTEEGDFYADKMIVCAGAWSGKLLSDLQLPLRPVRKTIAWFDADEELYSSSRFPAFIVSDESRFYYGFPSFDGKGVKIGRHDTGYDIDPDKLSYNFGEYPEDEGDVRVLLEKFMPQAAGRFKDGKVCMYTLTPDEHFIIDRHPEYAHVSIAAGFSGHGFKFGSVVGEILGQWTAGDPCPHSVEHFGIRRFLKG